MIEAIGNELSRAEAFDRNLFVISRDVGPETKTTAQLNELRDRLGANLVLAASGVADPRQFHLLLRALDPSSTRSIREKRINLPFDDRISFPVKAVRAAEELVGVNHYRLDDRRTTPDTKSPDAYLAFQEAETLMKQDNDMGLDAAIDKYKQALELDPRYATAYAKLALAYFRLYVMHGNSAAVSAARSNCDKALSLNPDSVEAHLALSSVLEYTGDKDGASREIEKALSIDPVNPRTLIYQAQLYSRLNRWPEAERRFTGFRNCAQITGLRTTKWELYFCLRGSIESPWVSIGSPASPRPKTRSCSTTLATFICDRGRLRKRKIVSPEVLLCIPMISQRSRWLLHCEVKGSLLTRFSLRRRPSIFKPFSKCRLAGARRLFFP